MEKHECILNLDMHRHRSFNKLIKVALEYCDNDPFSPRASYFDIAKLIDMRRKIEIKLLVQVPDSFINQIKNLTH